MNDDIFHSRFFNPKLKMWKKNCERSIDGMKSSSQESTKTIKWSKVRKSNQRKNNYQSSWLKKK